MDSIYEGENIYRKAQIANILGYTVHAIFHTTQSVPCRKKQLQTIHKQMSMDMLKKKKKKQTRNLFTDTKF